MARLTREAKRRKALKVAFWASMGRALALGLSAGAGSYLYQLVGQEGWHIAVAMAIVSFCMMWWAEFNREYFR